MRMALRIGGMELRSLGGINEFDLSTVLRNTQCEN